MLVPKLRFKREDGTEYSEWKSMPLGERFTFKNGINASREAFRAEGIHCIGVSDVYKCFPITAENVIGTVAISDDEIEKNKVGYGDILFQRSSETKEDIGHASVYFDNTTSVCNGFVICAKPDELFYDPLYLHYSLQNTRVRKQTITLGAGSGQHYNIGQEGLAQIKAVFPCLEEQEKIADFIYSIDEAIAQSEAEVQNLEQQKKAAMQKIFSQEVRFKCEDGTDYPEWEDCILSDYCEEIKTSIDPKKYPNDTFLEYSMPAFDIDKTPNTVIGSDMNSNRKIVNNPCVLINKLNVRKKRIWKVPNPTDNSVCSAEFIPVTSDKMSIDFLEHLALSDRFTARLLDCSTGTSNSQKRVTPDIIMDMPITIPCFEEQQKIADFLSAYDEAISYAKQELDK